MPKKTKYLGYNQSGQPGSERWFTTAKTGDGVLSPLGRAIKLIFRSADGKKLPPPKR